MQLREIIATAKTISFDNLKKDTALAEEVQINLTRLGLLDPPADGQFGRFSQQALTYFQSLAKISESGLAMQTSKALLEIKEAIPLKLSNDLASRIVKYMRDRRYFIALGEKRYNIVYLEGASADGTPNQDTTNLWNDRRIVLEIAAGTPKIVGNWVATTEPGRFYINNPMNPKGAARIAFDQYKAWQVGIHKDHEALVQVAPLKVHRDLNKDGFRNGDKIDLGLFAINQHWGYNLPQVDRASAGCLVGQSTDDHRKFMALIKQDRRYQLDRRYIFFTTVIPGDDLAQKFPA